MRLLFIFIIVGFELLSISGFAQTNTEWVKNEEVEQNGFYRNYGNNLEERTVGVIFNTTDKPEKDYYIRLNNPHINQIFVINRKGDTLYHTGDRLPFNSRPLNSWDFVFPIHVSAGTTDSVRFVLQHLGEHLHFFVESYSQEEYLSRRDTNIFLVGSFIAIYIMLFLGFLFLGIYRREAKNIYFALFIIVTGNWIINDQGVFFQYLWPNNTALQNKFGTYFNTSSTGLLFFLIYFLEVFKEKIDTVSRYTIYTLSGFVIGRTILVLIYPDLMSESFTKYTLLQISSVFMMGCSITLLWGLAWFIVKKEYTVEALGFGLFFLFAIRIILRQQGIDFLSFPRLDNFLFAVIQVITVLVFTISNVLAYRRSKRLQFEQNLLETEQKEREISQKIIVAQEYERTNIGKNLHDQLGGLLATLKIRLQMMKNKASENKEVDDAIRIVDRSSEEMYNIVDDLILPDLNGKGLKDLISNRVAILRANTGIAIELNMEGVSISEDTSIKIYRILCELLNNSVKHSGCDHISIRMLMTQKEMHIHYSDNGIGFDARTIEGRHGLKNIESRVKFLKGSIDLNSRPGNTSYFIAVPF